MSEGQQAVVGVFAIRGFVGEACAETAVAGAEAVYEVEAILSYVAYVDIVNA